MCQRFFCQIDSFRLGINASCDLLKHPKKGAMEMNMRRIMINICYATLALLLTSAGVVSAREMSSPTEFISAPNLSSVNYLPITLRNFPFRAGFVTDLAGIDDNGFNATQWAGVERAIDELGIAGSYLESSHSSQFEPNLRQFASQDYGLTIASGFMLGGALANVAAQYPNNMFTIVDYSYPDMFGNGECIPNVQGQIFKVDQAAFLAGYLAAGMTETGKIGWFGGMKIPTVTIFGIGYQKGMEHYNSVHTDNVQLIGWDSATGNGYFTDDFSDKTKGKEATEYLFNEGADIFMPVGGIIGEPGFNVARQNDGYGIWVDLDGFYILPQHQDVMLTSVMKNMDNSVYDVIEAAMEGNFNGCGVYKGDLVNEGVGIAPYHSLAGAVPAWLKVEVETLKANIISGLISDTGCISYPQHCPGGMY
jgi:basic membrane protein A